MIARRAGLAQVWAWLGEVADPEIPVLSVVDLGIVRDLAWVRGDDEHAGDGDRENAADRAGDRDSDGDVDAAGVLKVTVTPTYSGCPATRVIERDISRALREHGVERFAIEVRLAPPWTTDWLSDAGRDKLRAYGISSPAVASGETGALARGGIGVLGLTAVFEPGVACPRCASDDVELMSRFGSTPCKALYRCTACREPFDHFKCH